MGLRLVYSTREQRSRLEEASDLELLEALAAGEELALDELIQRKTKPLIQTVTRVIGDREEAKDVVQVTFIRLWDNRHKFDKRWSPNTWIYRIATNLAIDHLRSRRSRQRHAEPYGRHLRQISGGGIEKSFAELQSQEVGAIFEELAEGLTEKQRLAFVLREIDGLSSRETAEIMECRESTVRNHLFNARKTLQKAVIERYPEYASRVSPAEDDA